MVLERLVKNSYSIDLFKNAFVGQEMDKEWIITEMGRGTCEGFSGTLPWNIHRGESYRYFHLSGYHAQLRTIEIDRSGMKTYQGKWINPFDIKVR
jgi:hypothetical protein